jgi:hypothetical protein
MIVMEVVVVVMVVVVVLVVVVVVEVVLVLVVVVVVVVVVAVVQLHTQLYFHAMPHSIHPVQALFLRFIAPYLHGDRKVQFTP